MSVNSDFKNGISYKNGYQKNKKCDTKRKKKRLK